MCLLPFLPPSHLPASPTPLSCYRAPVWVFWVIWQIPIGYLFYTWECLCFHVSLSIRPCPPWVHKSVPCLCLHCCLVNRHFSTIFLDSIYVNIRYLFFSFWLTLHSIIGSRFILLKWLTQMCSFSWRVLFHYICVPVSLSVHLMMSI